MAPARPTWSSTPHPPAESLARLCFHYCPSFLTRDIWTLGEAGLNPSQHRDRSTKSRLPWSVLPATGIGSRRREPRLCATTDPNGCHVQTLSGSAANVSPRVTQRITFCDFVRPARRCRSPRTAGVASRTPARGNEPLNCAPGESGSCSWGAHRRRRIGSFFTDCHRNRHRSFRRVAARVTASRTRVRARRPWSAAGGLGQGAASGDDVIQKQHRRPWRLSGAVPYPEGGGGSCAGPLRRTQARLVRHLPHLPRRRPHPRFHPADPQPAYGGRRPPAHRVVPPPPDGPPRARHRHHGERPPHPPRPYGEGHGEGQHLRQHRPERPASPRSL